MSDRYNLGADLTDRHVVAGRGERRALVFHDSGGHRELFTYRRLAALANRFANVIRRLGVAPGDRVFFRVPNHPAFYYGALGCAKAGAVFIPSSTLFREQEVLYRLQDSEAAVVVTTAALAKEVEAVLARAPAVREVLLVDDAGEPPAPRRATSLSALMAAAPDHFIVTDTAADDPAFLAYSSGTTGDPKGILHLQRYARSYDYLIRDWHGYQDAADEVCACPPEIGWMLPVASTFLYSMRAGITTLLYREREPRFRPEVWLGLLAEHRVTSFVGTPTIYRMLLTVEGARRGELSTLARGTSAGEPLPADTLVQVRERFGFHPLDGIGMSECMVYAHNRIGETPAPGSCGRAGRGLVLEVMDDDMKPLPAGVPGVLCLRRDSHPGIMREYWRKPDATGEVLRGDWYWSGDVVQKDEQGRLFFAGRADDVMKVSGYRVSPFEVESALMSHPAVLEAAAVESPDPLKGSVVKCFCTLREGHRGDAALEEALRSHVKGLLAPFKAPRRVEFVAELPKTQSGKVRRRVLREQERERCGGR